MSELWMKTNGTPHAVNKSVALQQEEDDEIRLQMDLVCSAGAVFLSLLCVQCLHWRPSALLTHGGMSMLVGMALNGGLWATTSLTGTPRVLSIVLNSQVHEIVYFAFLPPIIFEAGFSLRKRGFLDNLMPILFYAVIGTLISTCAAGAFFYALSHCGIIHTALQPGEAVLFAALISPTDPVATLSVLRQVIDVAHLISQYLAPHPYRTPHLACAD